MLEDTSAWRIGGFVGTVDMVCIRNKATARALPTPAQSHKSVAPNPRSPPIHSLPLRLSSFRPSVYCTPSLTPSVHGRHRAPSQTPVPRQIGAQIDRHHPGLHKQASRTQWGQQGLATLRAFFSLSALPTISSRLARRSGSQSRAPLRQGTAV